MSAIDHMNDPKNKRKRVECLSWDSTDNVTLLINGVAMSGSLDWDKSRHFMGEFWAWLGESYIVLDADKWARKPIDDGAAMRLYCPALAKKEEEE